MTIKVGDMTLYSIKELADKFKIAPLTWKTYIDNGRIEGQKVGGHWYITEDNLKKFLKVNSVKK